MGVVDSVAEQTFKRHPWLFLFIIMTAGGLLGYSYQVFAQKIDVKARFTLVEEAITGIGKKLDRNSTVHEIYATEQRLRFAEAEIFQLERLEANGEVSMIIVQRLDRMKSERGTVSRKLSVLLNKL